MSAANRNRRRCRRSRRRATHRGRRSHPGRAGPERIAPCAVAPVADRECVRGGAPFDPHPRTPRLVLRAHVRGLARHCAHGASECSPAGLGRCAAPGARGDHAAEGLPRKTPRSPVRVVAHERGAPRTTSRDAGPAGECESDGRRPRQALARGTRTRTTALGTRVLECIGEFFGWCAGGPLRRRVSVRQ